jgi:hypothetical protein
MKDEVINGMSAEILAAIITYPLNTIKTNSQIGQIIKPSFRNLSKGFHWCLLTELVNSLIFYSIFEHNKKKKGPLIASTLGSSTAIITTYPLNTRRKLAQVGKSTNITNNYKGVRIGLFNGVPGNVINFTLREKFMEKSSKELKPFCGLLSTAISIVATHPLDTLSTCIATRSPFNFKNIFNGFTQRFVEKNLTIGSKMLILNYFNK